MKNGYWHVATERYLQLIKMKGFKREKEELLCLIEDAIIYNNDTYAKITGNSEKGYLVDNAKSVNEIENNISANETNKALLNVKSLLKK